MDNNSINHKDVAKVKRINKSNKSLISESKNQNSLTYIDFDPIINAKLSDAKVAISSEKQIDQFIDDYKDSISKVKTKKISDDDITDDLMADHMSQHHFLLYMIYKKQLITGKSKMSGFRKDLTDSERTRIESLFLQYVKDVKGIINKANKRKAIEKKGLSIADDLSDPNNPHYKEVMEIREKADQAKDLVETTNNNQIVITKYGLPDPKVTERILTVDLPELQKRNKEKREREAYERKMNQRQEYNIRLDNKHNELVDLFVKQQCIEGPDYKIDRDTLFEHYKKFAKCTITRISFVGKIKSYFPNYRNNTFYGFTIKEYLEYKQEDPTIDIITIDIISTDKYQEKRLNNIQLYIKNRIEKTNNNKDKIERSKLWEDFQSSEYKGNITRPQFNKTITEIFGNIKIYDGYRYYCGIKFL